MSGFFASLYRRERLVTIASLAVVVGLCVLVMQRSGDRVMMIDPGADSILYSSLVFVMWWTMMMAMMLPTAVPALLTFGAVSRRLDGSRAEARMFAFAAGYAVVWTLFSLTAMCVQIASTRILPLDPMMATTSRVAGGFLLIAAGV